MNNPTQYPKLTEKDPKWVHDYWRFVKQHHKELIMNKHSKRYQRTAPTPPLWQDPAGAAQRACAKGGWWKVKIADFKAWFKKETSGPGYLPPAEGFPTLPKAVDGELGDVVPELPKPQPVITTFDKGYDPKTHRVSYTKVTPGPKIIDDLPTPEVELLFNDLGQPVGINKTEKEQKALNTPGYKPTNPKDLVGVKKVAMSCLSMPVLMEMGLGMQEGAMKYGRHNYRHEGVAASTYFDAALRHLASWYEGQDTDPGSGLPHLVKLMTTIMVLRDAQIQGKETDDRPIKTVDKEWLEKLNKKAEALVAKYPNPEIPYTAIPMRPDCMPAPKLHLNTDEIEEQWKSKW